VRFPPKPPDEEFLNGYHNNCHSLVHSALDRSEEAVEFCFNGASEEQMGLMPTLTWGKESQPGVYRIIMEAIGGKFVAEFTLLLGLDRILGCQSLKAFLTLFHQENDSAAVDSLKQSQRNERVRVPEKLSVMKANVDEARSIVKAHRTNAKPTFDEAKHQAQLLADGKRWVEPYNSILRSKRQVDKSLAEEAKAIDEAIRREATLNVIQGPLDRFSNRGERLPNRISPAKPSAGSHNLACFDFAFTGTCQYSSDACKYSHDKSKCKEFLRDQNMKVLGSPHWEQKEFRLATMVHGSPHFDHSLNKLSGNKMQQKPDHVLGKMYQERYEDENEMYEEEHDRLLVQYIVANWN